MDPNETSRSKARKSLAVFLKAADKLLKGIIIIMQAGMTSPGNIAELTDEQLRELTGLGPREIRALQQRVVPGFDKVEVKLKDD